MANCCESILDLGCINFCDSIATGLTASATDTYTIVDVNNDNYFTVDFTEGDPITFTNRFNEDRVTVFQVKRGNTIIQSGDYDCFKVTVNPGTGLNESSSACEDATVVNSDGSYSVTATCGSTLTLPDTTFNVYLNGVLNQTFTNPTLDPTLNVNIYG